MTIGTSGAWDYLLSGKLAQLRGHLSFHARVAEVVFIGLSKDEKVYSVSSSALTLILLFFQGVYSWADGSPYNYRYWQEEQDVAWIRKNRSISVYERIIRNLLWRKIPLAII